jgi:hypothetical protein
MQNVTADDGGLFFKFTDVSEVLTASINMVIASILCSIQGGSHLQTEIPCLNYCQLFKAKLAPRKRCREE